MNDIPATNAPVPPIAPSPPGNWRTATADLVGSRLALIKLEAKDAARSTGKRVVFLAAGAILLLLAWVILVAGLVGVISDKGGIAWYWVTLIAGGIHLLLAVIFINIAKRPGDPTFKYTAAEFKKDREWLENFQSPKKSND